jgi:hypothetical protein
MLAAGKVVARAGKCEFLSRNLEKLEQEALKAFKGTHLVQALKRRRCDFRS